MPRNGSGVYSPSVTFATEAASPPIEISKLDSAITDIASALTASLTADGQTQPSANIPLNGFKLTNVGAATALTEYVRVSELIDQDHVYYVDSGAADAYVITPDPAISGYEEGQLFWFRAANANTGASTLNVNGEGAIAIQTPDGSALTAGMIAAGGYYAVIYDANPATDRFVLVSLPSAIDDLLSSNVPLLDTENTFTANIKIENATPFLIINDTNGTAGAHIWHWIVNDTDLRGQVLTDAEVNGENWVTVKANGSSEITSIALAGDSITANGSAVLTEADEGTGNGLDADTVDGIEAAALRDATINAQNGSYTLVIGDAGKTIYKASGGAGETITIPANSAVAFPTGTMVTFVNQGGGALSIAITTDTLTLAGSGSTGTRTLADDGMATAIKVTSTSWMISGSGLS